MRFTVEQYDGVPDLIKTEEVIRGNRWKALMRIILRGAEATVETIHVKDSTGATRLLYTLSILLILMLSLPSEASAGWGCWWGPGSVRVHAPGVNVNVNAPHCRTCDHGHYNGWHYLGPWCRVRVYYNCPHCEAERRRIECPKPPEELPRPPRPEPPELPSRPERPKKKKKSKANKE